MRVYPQVEETLRPLLRVRMPRAPRFVAPGGTAHVVARCNNREFYLQSPEDFDDPATYPWSSCAAYACGAANPRITFHPSYLGLSPYPAVRQRHYRILLAPTGDPRADARDPRWTTQRAIGSPGFVAPHLLQRGRRRIETMPSQNQGVSSLAIITVIL